MSQPGYCDTSQLLPAYDPINTNTVMSMHVTQGHARYECSGTDEYIKMCVNYHNTNKGRYGKVSGSGISPSYK